MGDSPETPTLGSLAAREVGGALMASPGMVVRPLDQHALPVPDVPASAWVVANADTGQVLAAKDPHGEFGPASTLKVLTAVTLIPLLNPDCYAERQQVRCLAGASSTLVSPRGARTKSPTSSRRCC